MPHDGDHNIDDPLSALRSFNKMMETPAGQAIRSEILEKMKERIRKEEEAKKQAESDKPEPTT